jgi:hypothetical protein
MGAPGRMSHVGHYGRGFADFRVDELRRLLAPDVRRIGFIGAALIESLINGS